MISPRVRFSLLGFIESPVGPQPAEIHRAFASVSAKPSADRFEAGTEQGRLVLRYLATLDLESRGDSERFLTALAYLVTKPLSKLQDHLAQLEGFNTSVDEDGYGDAMTGAMFKMSEALSLWSVHHRVEALRELMHALEVEDIHWIDDRFVLLRPSTGDIGTLSAHQINDRYGARLRRARNGADHAATIGYAKELVEAVAHAILQNHGVQTPKTMALSRLCIEAAKALGLRVGHNIDRHANTLVDGLARIVDGLAQMRNRHGTGHGRPEPSAAQGHHAELAAASAIAWVNFVLSVQDAQS